MSRPPLLIGPRPPAGGASSSRRRRWACSSNAPRDDHPTDRVVAYDIETICSEESADGSFPPIPQHRPVAAAFLALTRPPEGRHDFRLDVLLCREGREEQFLKKIDARLSPGVVGVGWKTRGFDNPVLRLQAMRHRVFDLSGLARQTQTGRYDAIHCNLADQFSSYGASRTLSLKAVCDTLEIPVKITASGDEVAKLWAVGDTRTVARYVADDAIGTWLVWLHLAAWKTADPAEFALPAADFATWLESDSQLEPFRAFADCPPVRWARSAAPGLRADAALKDAERRLARVRDEEAFSASPF